MSKSRFTVALGCLLALALASTAGAAELPYMDPDNAYGVFTTEDGSEVAFHKMGGMLPNTCDYDWWYGCSPTSAGMLAGYYDRNGIYDLVGGGVAESETYAGPPTGWAAVANIAIASQGHVGDFYVGGYGASGDDKSPPHHGFNSLADFMGTSQDSCGNSNGATTFFNWTNGAKLHYYEIPGLEPSLPGITDVSGMYGIYEYIKYAGYDVDDVYNQYIVEMGKTYGFSLGDYKAEIDADRPVLIHIEGHTMCGVGYSTGSTIQVYDTWSPGPHDMTWAGSYGGSGHWGVTVVQPIPEPSTLVLLVIAAGIGAVGYLRRRRR